MEEEPDLVVALRVDAPEAELAADRLWQAGATAVAEHEEVAGMVTLVASYPTAAAAALVAGEVGGRLVEVDPAAVDGWKATVEPVDVGDLVVAPAWRDVAVGEGRLVLRIDSGRVFGSGTHASTRMLLAALAETPPLGLDVVDVGCGSGILSVAAARLGARSVTAVDIDDEAVAVTVANAAANGVDGVVSASTTPVGALDGSFDLALVNVTAAVHAVVGPHVAARTRPGGRILLAGLLAGQWRHVAAAYAPWQVREPLEGEGWEGMVLGTPAP